MLADVRSRAHVVRTAAGTASAAMVAQLATPLFEGPLAQPPFGEYVTDAVLAGAGAAVASAVMLFITPILERVFEVTTGMTLSELRDPRQPLLRQLQQQAPGTYNHSLNVATIAEAAADAIGADSLHLYVGALYHDVGKINKPDYFVENQTPGINRHDKLSPAMSLLVIMGHVKDGIELAREYKLPRSFRHYIESHHGETLVTYFYHQAKAAAEAENAEAPKGPPAGMSPDAAETAKKPPVAADLARYTSDLEGSGKLYATITTTAGPFNCELYEKIAPITIANFVGLARGLKAWTDPRDKQVKTGTRFYDGILFHRVIPNFMVQTGDPLGQGNGGPGYNIPDEFDAKVKHDSPGILSMANTGRPGSGGSQFFITEVPTPHLDGKHTVFGKCDNTKLVKEITRVPTTANRPNEPVKIKKITISRK